MEDKTTKKSKSLFIMTKNSTSKIMRLKIICIVLFILLSNAFTAQSQESDSTLIEKNKLVNLGFCFGLLKPSLVVSGYNTLGDNPEYQVNMPNSQPFPVNEESYFAPTAISDVNNLGLVVGFVATLKMSESFELRLTPSYSFYNAKVSYNVPVVNINFYEPRDHVVIDPSYLSLSLLLKYSNNTIYNGNPYLIAGGSYNKYLDKAKDVEVLTLNQDDTHIEFGLGLTKLLKISRIGIELKAGIGLRNILGDYPPPEQHQFYRQSIKTIRSNIVTLSMIFD